MSYLDHIRACNNADPSRYWPFLVEGRRLGAVRPAFAAQLARFPAVFDVAEGRVALAARLAAPEARTAAVADVTARLCAEGVLPPPRGEMYAVNESWGLPPTFLVERKYVAAFGVPAYGVHVNGVVRDGDRLSLWIGTRSSDKDVAPGKLDNMVAGGQPAGLGLLENVVKESGEEAGIPPALARTARPVGVIRYLMEDELGLKPDVLFIYDLDVPRDFRPHNTDGEIAAFALMPAETVARRVRDSVDFKFNVNLVIIDFLIRHGLMSPDGEPDYVALATGLRRL